MTIIYGKGKSSVWIKKSHRSFTNYALKYIENPLLMVITGSRMYGFNDEESDWDVFAVSAQPSVKFFELDKPVTDFLTPERMLYNRRVSVKVQDIERVFRNLIDGDMKTFERLLSPLVTMRTEGYYQIKRLAKKCVTQKLIRDYLENGDAYLKDFEERVK